MIPERYEKYKTTLIGKCIADEYTKLFNGNQKSNEKEVYSNTFNDNGKFWLLNITKIVTENYEYENHRYIKRKSFFSIYFHKTKDMVVLKFPLNIYVFDKCDNNIRNYFSKILNKLGYSQYDFFNGKNGITKILIPQDKDEDDLARLLIICEKYNEYIASNSIMIWDNPEEITFNVDSI